MPEKFAIVGENEPYPGAKKRVYVLGKKQPKHGASNGEIDLYLSGQVKSGVAIALMEDQTEQASNLRDLRKPSSPLGYLTSQHSLTKGTLRIISQEELDMILASLPSEESAPDIGLRDSGRTRSTRGSSNWWDQY